MKTVIPCKKCGALNRIDTDRNGQAKCGSCKSTLESQGPIVDVTLASLKALIESSPLPVVVDFWAPWCGPCRAFAPTYSGTAERRAGEFVFAKLNTQDHQDAAAAFGIRGIPTLAVFNKGKELARQAGAMEPRIFDAFLDQATVK